MILPTDGRAACARARKAYLGKRGSRPSARGTMGLFKGKGEENVVDHDTCAVASCGKPADRHFARGKVEAALPKERILATRGSAGLCRDHYRSFKKATKEERDLDRQGW